MRHLIFALAIISGLVGSANADVITYGNLMGATVFFNDITESSSSIPTLAPDLFGAPTASGNNLNFSPLNFEASQGGPGIERVDGQLNVNVVAKPGFKITSVKIEEFGDYAITVPFNGSQGGFVSAALNAFGVTAGGGVVDSQDVFIAATPTPPGIPAAPWSLTALLSGFSPADSLGIRLDNRLTAASFSQFDDSIIKKKGFLITVFGIPEPTSAMLILMCGVAGLPLYRRR